MIENANLRRWVEALEKARESSKNPKQIAYLIKLSSKPKRSRPSVNLDKLQRYAKDNDTIIVPGKVLGSGSISKKITLAAIDYSEGAEAKLKDANCKVVKVEEVIGNKSARIII